MLTANGIRALEYTGKILPPSAYVIPDDTYLEVRPGDGFGKTNVAIQVLLVGAKATTEAAAERMDEMIVTAFEVLNEEFDVTSVAAPRSVVIGNEEFIASVITLEVQITITKG